jgi:hypothetical protein
VSNRHQRRASIATYRRSASNSLLTWLVPPDTTIGVTVLDSAAGAWLDCLPTVVPSRSCICCRAPLHHRDDTGALLLSVPALTSKLASVAGLCVMCWEGAEIEVIERAVERTLSVVMPGRLERDKCGAQ